MNKPLSRRQRFKQTKAPPEKLDPTPIEIPVNARQDSNSVREQIQRQIAIQLSKKNTGLSS